MHANQIEETNELILCDQLHVQPAVFSSPKTPITNYVNLMFKKVH